ncbi:MAG: hypothetical protein IH971_10095 [Candidatus Marinimicrobia bacterium]|nr:hypothetical protein [Candidatus Neomarinimicrobiota bacterium]
MKAHHLMAAILVVGLATGTALGQANGWKDNGINVTLDVITDRVGIGTETPAVKLEALGIIRSIDVAGGNDYMQLESNASGGVLKGFAGGSANIMLRTYGESYFLGGNIGIGTSSPTNRLSFGTSSIISTATSDGSDSDYLRITGGGTASSTRGAILLLYGNEHANTGQVHINSGGVSGGDIIFNTGASGEVVRIKAGGNMGIGTTNPGTYKLAVNGEIRAKEVIVETGWSDFVFEEHYALRPLSEVEAFIKANKHLPDIPSEKEVSENGLGLGEMQAKLLRKVEELTLYMIEMKKENEAFRAGLARLESN